MGRADAFWLASRGVQQMNLAVRFSEAALSRGLPVLALILNFVLPAHMAMAGDVQALVYMMGQDMNGFSFGPIPTALFALTLAGVAYNAIYLSVMPGQAGPNEYGPDPNGGVALSRDGRIPPEILAATEAAIAKFRSGEPASASPAPPPATAAAPTRRPRRAGSAPPTGRRLRWPAAWCGVRR